MNHTQMVCLCPCLWHWVSRIIDVQMSNSAKKVDIKPSRWEIMVGLVGLPVANDTIEKGLVSWLEREIHQAPAGMNHVAMKFDEGDEANMPHIPILGKEYWNVLDRKGIDRMIG